MRQENLSNPLTEAMACGVPVVAFDVGGMTDMIVHRENGYLAKAFDCEELAEGISLCAGILCTLSEISTDNYVLIYRKSKIRSLYE